MPSVVVVITVGMDMAGATRGLLSNRMSLAGEEGYSPTRTIRIEGAGELIVAGRGPAQMGA